MQAYCVKCKMKVDVNDGEDVVLDTKRGKKKFLMGRLVIFIYQIHI